MKISIQNNLWVSAGFIVAMLAGQPALADDTELLLQNPDPAANPKPNILFILDTSGSMDTDEKTTKPYESTTVYSGDCNTDRIYWSDVDILPDCTTSTNYVDDAEFHCDYSTRQIDGIGSFTNTMVQYRDGGPDGTVSSTTTPTYWQTLAPGYNSHPIECQADFGSHGDGRPTYLWAGAGTNLSDEYVDDATMGLSWGSPPRNISYTVYDGNYINWKNNPQEVTMTRAEIMQVVTKKVLSSVDNLNVGLMRFNETQGGAISVGIKDLAANRQTMLDTIDTYDPDGWTPLSETMYEAALYWRGMTANFANIGDYPTDTAALSATAPARIYQEPSWDSCAKNYNVLLTDGEPTEDDDGPALITALPGFAATMGSAACTGTGQGACLDDVAEYLSKFDVDPIADDDQFVTTHTIGFAVDLDILKTTAENSGGEYFLADDVESLTKSLLSILANINDRSLSFAAPAVSVNTFNRTQNLNDLFITVFGAKARAHWPGNLKKYRIVNREITDAATVAAVDPDSGFFLNTAESFWSGLEDGNDVTRGGAANELPAPGSRKLYTNRTGTDLTAAGNAVSPGNMNSFTDADFGLTGATGEPSKEDVIRWARGEDLLDVNSTSTVRYEMGDPLHSQPAAVIYGGTAASPDMVVFMATNDGYLHAIDAASGAELWSFIPHNLLGNLTRLYFDPVSRYKQYGLDGNIAQAVKDVDGDGIIESGDGDFVYLVFGMRRGGNTLYALDVTNKNSPQMLWDVSLPEFGESWSTPVISRMNIASTSQNTDKAVVVVGGGYDTVHDTAAHPSAADGAGAGIHILDLESGAELWRAGADTAADLTISDMTRSIATEVRVIDFSGDGFANRMYASDMGGRIWRFDVFNGEAPSALVTGGVIAELGAEGATSPGAADTRRFYNAPDVSIFTDNYQQRRFIAISIGSGYRAHPFDLTAADRFFSLRDGDVFTKLDQSAYTSYDVITDSDLVEVSGKTKTVISSTDRGWKFTLPSNQKVLADSLTFDDQIFFVAFSPDTVAAANCSGRGANFLYQMSIENGDPIVTNIDTLDPLDSDDERSRTLQQGGIAPSPTILFPSPDNSACTGSACSPPPLGCVGVECFDPGFKNNPVRTLWTQDGIE